MEMNFIEEWLAVWLGTWTINNADKTMWMRRARNSY